MLFLCLRSYCFASEWPSLPASTIGFAAASPGAPQRSGNDSGDGTNSINNSGNKEREIFSYSAFSLEAPRLSDNVLYRSEMQHVEWVFAIPPFLLSVSTVPTAGTQTKHTQQRRRPRQAGVSNDRPSTTAVAIFSHALFVLSSTYWQIFTRDSPGTTQRQHNSLRLSRTRSFYDCGVWFSNGLRPSQLPILKRACVDVQFIVCVCRQSACANKLVHSFVMTRMFIHACNRVYLFV